MTSQVDYLELGGASRRLVKGTEQMSLDLTQQDKRERTPIPLALMLPYERRIMSQVFVEKTDGQDAYYLGDGFFEFDGSWADAKTLRMTKEFGGRDSISHRRYRKPSNSARYRVRETLKKGAAKIKSKLKLTGTAEPVTKPRAGAGGRPQDPGSG